MIFGCLGRFRALLVRENRTLRYISDSSYWLYLSHLPPVIVAQVIIRKWQLPWPIKLTLLSIVTTAVLLLIYDKLIRYTRVGTILNGPRTRPATTRTPTAAAEASAG